jgi:putative nucleotidyltransferase with HDIG domain
MNRSVLIIQPDKHALIELSRIFKQRGDEIHTAPSLKDASTQLKLTLPDLILIDTTLLGSKWPKSIPALLKRFQKTELLFTYSSNEGLPKSYYKELVKWKVLTNPITPERVSLAVDGNLTDIDILEPLQKKSRLTYPIRFQISLPYLILSLFFTLSVTYITTRVVFDSAEERFANQLIESGKLSSEWIVLEEDRLLESLRLVVNTTGLPRAVSNEEINVIHRLIYPLAVNSQVEDIEIINSDGSTIYSLRHRTGGSIEDYQNSTGGEDFSNAEFIQTILKEHLDSFGDKYAAVENPPWGHVFYVAGPIVNQDRIVGAALVGITLPTLVGEIRETTLAQTTLYDFEGRVLATTFIAGQELDPGLIAQIIPGQDDFSLLNNKTVADINYTELLGPWEVRNDLDIGILGAALPQNYLVHTSWVTRTQIFVALGAFIGLILMIGFRLANRISKPLESLAKASEEVAAGNYMVALESPETNEVAVLTASFNHMLKSLKVSQSELMEAYDSSLEGWSRALSLRDHGTDDHSRRVVELTLKLARIYGLHETDLEPIRRGALLHDIGKVGIPDEILQKTGPLSDEEWIIMKKHPLYAAEMLQPISFMQDSLEIPLYHHERWDGTGYPHGLKRDAIPISARIFAVADVYDALLSKRPYRDAWTKEEALHYLSENRGKHFDPQIIDLFFKHFID